MKDDAYRVRITIGRDCLDYTNNTWFLAANLLETKILINSTISDIDKGTYFISTEIKDYFLAIIIKDSEYIKVSYKYILLDIYRKYNLDLLIILDNKVFVKI